jgi:hypothetical protein
MIRATLLAVLVITSGCKQSSNPEAAQEKNQSYSAKTKKQKIVWNYNGDYAFNSNNSDFFEAQWSRENSAYVSETCQNMSSDLDALTKDGWSIVSISPASRNVSPKDFWGGGVCDGRDVVIEGYE